MNKEIPRLRMFAGPNGSGKSTLKSIIRPELLGIYVSPVSLIESLKLKTVSFIRQAKNKAWGI